MAQETTTNATENKEPETKTFTQQELNQTVSDRLKREREKYADYEELKKKAEAYDKYQEESKTELQKATDKAESLQKELDDLKQAEVTRQLKAKVAKETGVPMDILDRLNGTTEEELKAGADALKAFRPTYPNIPDGGEAGGDIKTSTAQQFADWLNNSQ